MNTTRYCKKFQVDILTYCLMDNHVHLLVVPQEQDSLARAVGTTNLVYSQYFNRKQKRTGRIWQNRFFSCIVDRDAYLWSVARYIERNPVRAGMVTHPVEYRWSSAGAMVNGDGSAPLETEEWLPPEDRDAYAEFLNQPDTDQDQIRGATATGRPLGQDHFVLRLEALTGRRLRAARPGRPRTRED